jgi:hypothetical protein
MPVFIALHDGNEMIQKYSESSHLSLKTDWVVHVGSNASVPV